MARTGRPLGRPKAILLINDIEYRFCHLCEKVRLQCLFQRSICTKYANMKYNHKCNDCQKTFRNSDKMRAKHRIYGSKFRRTHLEAERKRGREQKRKAYLIHKTEIRFRNNLREYLERGAEGKFTLQEWNETLKHFNYECVVCHRKPPEIEITKDHVIPLIKGGTNYIENLIPLCKSCNSSKQEGGLEWLEPRISPETFKEIKERVQIKLLMRLKQ